MTDRVGNKDTAFVYTYSAQRNKEIEKIRNKYLPKEESKLEKLIRLDKQTEKKNFIMLVLALGMCILHNLVEITGLCIFKKSF